jgi:serine/threonine protein kinase
MMSQLDSSELGMTGSLRLETDVAFERYRVLAAIGRGGMSEVFLAGMEQDGNIQRLAVMKRLNAELCGDPTTVQMFLDEARIGLRLSHPNIVQTHDVGRFEGRLCILMDYLKGQPLHRVIHRAAEQGKVLPLELAVKIIVDVLDGLGAAHAACDYDGAPLGVVHRDISPHNLFIEYDGRVKLLDFGIAKAAIQEGATRTGLVKGKFAYMAPEQARSEPIDQRADIWSVGVVFWELITGARLFKGPSEAAMLQATLKSPIPYPAAYRSDVPPLLEQVVQRALERDRSLRYGSALEMKDALERWLEAQGRGYTATLAAFMNDAFGPERDEQQSFVRDLLAQRSLSPTSSGTMARFAALGVPHRTQMHATELAELAQHRTQTNQLMLVLEQKSRLATWILLGLLALVFGLLLGVGVVVLRAPAGAERPASQVRRPAPIEPATPTAPPTPRPVVSEPALAQGPELAPIAPSPGAISVSPARADVARAPRREPARERSAPAGSERSAAPKPSTSSAKLAEPGFLTLDTSPWSVVSSGGRVLGSTPLVHAALPPGDVVLSLSNPDTGAHATYTVRIEAGKTVSRRIGLE